MKFYIRNFFHVLALEFDLGNEILRNGEEYSSAQEERRRSREAWQQMRKAQREKESALKAELRKG